MDNFKYLLQFSRDRAIEWKQTGIGGGKLRDLRTVYELKLKGSHPEKLVAVRDSVFAACGVDSNIKLDDPMYARRRWAAVIVLASALIHGTRSGPLAELYKKMYNWGIDGCRHELRALMTVDDLRLSRHCHVTLKNFASAGYNSKVWAETALRAYDQTKSILDKVNKYFLNPGGSGIPPGVSAVFQKYFGSFSHPVNAASIAWKPPAAVYPPAFHVHGNIRAGAVVAEVLLRLWCFFEQKETLRFCLSGSGNHYSSSFASVDGTVRPTEIFLAEKFFDSNFLTMRGYTQRRILIQQLSQSWARTANHTKYGQPLPTQLASQLSNAESYASFVEEAFGFY